MSLVIDGYNLLEASGIVGGGRGPGGLERARRALLDFLAESLDGRQLAGTVVVFDARQAPPGLPRQTTHRGIKVQFADRRSDADQEIEQLIASHTAPRRLIVVSSDHRLQRAARRRRATPIDSDVWYAQILRRRIDRAREKGPARKPSAPPSEAEVRYWLRQFGIEEETPPPGDETIAHNPFPPGYGDDAADDDV